MTIEEFKQEKALQDIQLKKEKALSQKPFITFDFYMTNLHNVLRLIGDDRWNQYRGRAKMSRTKK